MELGILSTLRRLMSRMGFAPDKAHTLVKGRQVPDQHTPLPLTW